MWLLSKSMCSLGVSMCCLANNSRLARGTTGPIQYYSYVVVFFMFIPFSLFFIGFLLSFLGFRFFLFPYHFLLSFFVFSSVFLRFLILFSIIFSMHIVHFWSTLQTFLNMFNIFKIYVLVSSIFHKHCVFFIHLKYILNIYLIFSILD